MTAATLPQQILQDVQSLSEIQQHQVLNYIRTLRNDHSKSGTALVQLAGTISIEDLLLMEKAIQDGCEQIDSHDW